MAADADAVLWALRGLHDSHGRGVVADDVARFMSKDATLSEHYAGPDVAEVLDALVEEGVLTRVSELDAPGTTAPFVQYRFASGGDTLEAAFADFPSFDDAEEPFSQVEVEKRYDLLFEALADESVDPTHDSEEAELRSRITELKKERDTLLADRDALRDCMNETNVQLTRSADETARLRECVRRLETELERERVISLERLETMRRAAAAFSDALDTVEATSAASERPETGSRARNGLQGNWLE
jgi:hypothetical protein